MSSPESIPDLSSHWLDVDSSDPAQHALLANRFRFHPLAIEDTLNAHTRVKIEAYDGYVFIVLLAMRFAPDSSLTPRDLGAERICIFLSDDMIVSVHAGPSQIIDRARELLRERNGDAACEPAMIAHAIADTIIDDYFPIRDRIDAFVERLESETPQRQSRTLRDALAVRRVAFAAQRSLIPQQEIFESLATGSNACVSASARLYFRDVLDHCRRIIDSMDAFGHLIAELTDSNVAELSIRLDYATTIFAGIATIATPFIIISGIFGMNFRQMPFLRDPTGFWIVIGAQTLISAGLFVLLRRRHLV